MQAQGMQCSGLLGRGRPEPAYLRTLLPEEPSFVAGLSLQYPEDRNHDLPMRVD